MAVTPEVHQRNLKEVAEEYLAKNKNGERLKAAFPGAKLAMPGPVIPKSEDDQYAFFIMYTDPADYPFIRDKYYLQKWRRGWLPAPVSPIWANALAIPHLFETMQQIFNHIHDKRIKRLTGQEAV